MSYKSFEFNFPTKIVFGPGESKKAAEYAVGLGNEKILVLTYGDVMLPAVKVLLEELDRLGRPYALYNRCLANPKAEDVDRAAAFCTEQGCGLVLGVGGGSVIDTAKAVALLAANPCEGGIWDYVSFSAEPKNRALPIMLVVTIASTGSEGNESFVLTDREDRQKLIYNHPFVRPTLSICDPELSVTLPPRQTALGAIDVFSHILEQYLHADNAVEVSDNMSFGVMEAVVRWLPVAVKEPENMDARSNLLWAAILAMSRMFGVGHEENWLVHMLEHAVSARYNVAHAAGMSALMPAYLDFIRKKNLSPDKLDRLAALFGAEDAAEGLRAFERRNGLPADLFELLGSEPEEAVLRDMAVNALPWGSMEAAAYGEFTQEDAYTVLCSAFRSK